MLEHVFLNLVTIAACCHGNCVFRHGPLGYLIFELRAVRSISSGGATQAHRHVILLKIPDLFLISHFNLVSIVVSFFWVFPRHSIFEPNLLPYKYTQHSQPQPFFIPSCLWRRNRQCPETSAHKIQATGNYSEESIQITCFILCLWDRASSW